MKILLISEVPVMNKMLRKYIMTELGEATIETVGSPLHAISLLQQNRYDVVLCSREMKELDGFMVKDKMTLTEPNKETPFVMMTSNYTDKHLYQLVERGIKYYLPIPCDASKVKDVINEAANPRKFRQFTRHAINKTTALITIEDHQLKGSVVNISQQGIMCEVVLDPPPLNILHNCFITIYFPEKYHNAVCKNIEAQLVRLSVSSQQKGADSVPCLNCVWKFDNVPEESQEQLNRVLDKADQRMIDMEKSLQQSITTLGDLDKTI